MRKKKTKNKSKKRKTNINLIITSPHWYCINKDENLCDQSSHINSKIIYTDIKKKLKNKVVLLKPPKIHRQISDANRPINKKLGLYHPLLNKFLKDIKSNLSRKPKMLLDVHSYSKNNNLPFYLLHLNINSQKELANEFALRICENANISFNKDMVKIGTYDNEIIRLALERKTIKMAIIVELYDNNSDFDRNILLESIKDTTIEFLEYIL